MGDSASKPRRGHKNPRHLPKVGTPANNAWEHRTRTALVFGSGTRSTLLIAAVIVAIIVLALSIAT